MKHLIFVHLIFYQGVSIQSGCCPNFGPVPCCLNKRNAKLKSNGCWLEGRGSVDAHFVSSQVLICCCRVEGTGNLCLETIWTENLSRKNHLSSEPVDPNLSHEGGESLAGLELVLAQPFGGHLVGDDHGGDQEQWQKEKHSLNLRRLELNWWFPGCWSF